MDFMGMRMTVVLRDPPGFSIDGTVSAIVPSELLSLENVYFLSTGESCARLDLNPDNIADIRATPPEPPSFTAPAPSAVPAPTFPNPPPNATFQDPAILSMGRRPGPSRNDENRPNIGEKRDPLPFTFPDPAPNAIDPLTKDLGRLVVGKDVAKLKVTAPDPSRLDTTEDEVTNKTPTAINDQIPVKTGKRPQHRQRKGAKNSRRQDGEQTPTTSAKPTEHGDGWRQTPILQSNKSFQPFASLKRNQKGKNAASAENDWASEDVTDVQEAGDFDFEGSLAKFDKRTIFDEMRQHDQIDESERLVSHNRLPRPKPGTAGGKNFHYTENVLDAPSTTVSKLKETPDDYWKSEADDATIHSAERLSGREGSGRTSRLRGESRMSTNRRSQSRKASTTQSIGGPIRGNSGVGFSHHLVVPRPDIYQQPVTTPTAEGFYSIPSSRRIETVTHLQMLNIENISHNELEYTEELMAENSGRSISDVALTALSDPAVKLRSATASPPNVATIVILAGNNKSGSRAIAAGRHLRNHGVNVLVCVVGIERERELVEEVRKQIRLFRNFGGSVNSKSQLFENLSKATTTLNSSPQAPVTLIIDALLGLSISFEELRKSDQATTYELMEWANRNEAFVIAIDVPSGIDPTTGKVNIIDGAKLYVQPRYAIALGAPKQGLLKAMELGHEQRDDITTEDWKLYLADIGLSTTIWRKAATKLRRGIDFDDKWILEMRYQPPPEALD